MLSVGWAVVAQAPSPTPPASTSAKKASAAPGVRPAWSELTPAQRDALAPLAGQWETLGPERKRKWLDVAAKYPKLTPDAQQHVQQRMGEFARLSPEQRVTARENFRSAYELPADKRQEKLQRYQELPDDKKRALAEQAAKKQAAPRPQPSKSTTAPTAPTK
ncbi:MAG TPA: DUF3106 domain-containing protein [Burkholderiaceae bacterium]|nr:DUF3106 domain-containing protein [Burkholderiaceae bacterium]